MSRNDPIPAEPTDIVGLDLHHGDRNLGGIEEVLEHGGRDYLVVDTRHWTFGSRRIIPFELVGSHIVEHDGAPIVASPTADPDHIRDAPDFDPFRLADEAYWDSVDRHYEQVGTDRPSGD